MDNKPAAHNAAPVPTAKFKLSKLADNAEKLFHVSACAFAGATANLVDGEYTIEEIAAIIEAWQKKEAK